MIKITEEELKQYFEDSSSFSSVYVGNNIMLYIREKNGKIAAYRDIDGECFANTTYWKIAV